MVKLYREGSYQKMGRFLIDLTLILAAQSIILPNGNQLNPILLISFFPLPNPAGAVPTVDPSGNHFPIPSLTLNLSWNSQQS